MSAPVTTPPAPGRAEVLLPCPFCGWRKPHIAEDDKTLRVECPECFADGPPEDSEREAAELWNRRPAPAVDAEVGEVKRYEISAGWTTPEMCEAIGDVATTVVLASDYDAALRTLAEVRGELTRTQQELRKAESERDQARVELATVRTNLYRALDAKQAKIDALMFEFCPGEMSAEQREEWARNQSPTPGGAK